MSIRTKLVSEYDSCTYVGKLPELLKGTKEFAGRNELNGCWEEDTFWGTRPAVDLVRAFTDGYFYLLSQQAQSAAERATSSKELGKGVSYVN